MLCRSIKSSLACTSQYSLPIGLPDEVVISLASLGKTRSRSSPSIAVESECEREITQREGEVKLRILGTSVRSRIICMYPGKYMCVWTSTDPTLCIETLLNHSMRVERRVNEPWKSSSSLLGETLTRKWIPLCLSGKRRDKGRSMNLENATITYTYMQSSWNHCS